METASLARQRIVLLGAGHTNSHVIRQWGMGKRIADSELVCVSNWPTATYSGMMPSVVAGDVPPQAMQIDLIRLARRSGCRLIVANPTGIDRHQQTIQFADRPPLEYDFLSIGVGSQPTFSDVQVVNEAGLVTIKPMQSFLDRLTQALLDRSEEHTDSLRVAVIGGGVASAEIGCCLAARFFKRNATGDQLDQAMLRFSDLQISLISANQIGQELKPSTRRRLNQELLQYSIESINQQRITQIDNGKLSFTDQSVKAFDLVIWATGAVATPLLQTLDLPKDDRGFLLTDSDLRSIADAKIFAVGDAGTIRQHPTPKAGVYAVRQGPILWENLRRVLQNKSSIPYSPQTGFLKLINVGRSRAIGEYHGWSFTGRLAWKLKMRIDTKFMAMYQNYQMMSVEAGKESDHQMNCLGCGGKLSSDVLEETLKSSLAKATATDQVLIGLEQADDAAVLQFGQETVALTTDYFAAPLDDPFLFGQMVAIHSLSDLFAMGSTPVAALVNLEIPFGHPRGQRRLATELMAGITDELAKSNSSLIGGHSIEGPRLAAGLTAIGQQKAPATRKGNLQPGDCLVLTKPLGVGLALAAHMRNELRADEFTELVHVLRQSNSIAVSVIEKFQIGSITDVTGFGLLGHLIEMINASHLSAEIELIQIPKMSFVKRLVGLGIASSLAPSNQALAARLNVKYDPDDWRVATLFDPQSCGGLLMGVCADQLEPLLAYLHTSGFSQAACVGSVSQPKVGESQIQLV